MVLSDDQSALRGRARKKLVSGYKARRKKAKDQGRELVKAARRQYFQAFQTNSAGAKSVSVWTRDRVTRVPRSACCCMIARARPALADGCRALLVAWTSRASVEKQWRHGGVVAVV